MSEKKDWSLVDKRIRARKPSWTKEEQADLDARLNSLPDLADQAEVIEMAQPALDEEDPPQEEAVAEADDAAAAPADAAALDLN
jgi:hypothetical protein